MFVIRYMRPLPCAHYHLNDTSRDQIFIRHLPVPRSWVSSVFLQSPSLKTLFNMDVANDEHPREVLGRLNALRARSELTDVVLEVEGRSFPCHRAVLAACSPYFSSMFTSGYAEINQRSVGIQGVSHVAMATILDYAYTGSLKMEPDQVQAVMSAARLLQVDFVYQKASECMEALLDVTNCADVLMYADMLGDLLTLQEASRTYMASRFNQVALQPSFLQLSLPQLQSVLNRDDLLTSSEDDVVQAALRWVDFDLEERLPHLPAICKSFRYSFISAQCRVKLESTSKCLLTDCKLVFENTATQRPGQRRAKTLIFLKEGMIKAGIGLPPTVPCYDPSNSTIYSMNMPHDLGGFFSVVVTPDDELYLAGGSKLEESDPERQKTFLQYCHLLNAWETRCDMIAPRWRCGLVYHKGYIYAIGGDDTEKTAERYDPSCDEWTSIAPLPSPISSKLCAVSLDNSIYVISEEGCYCFIPTENKWNKIVDGPNPPQFPLAVPSMLTPVPRSQAVAYQGCIYCVNWRSNNNSCWIEMYTPKDNVWKRCGYRNLYCKNAILMPCQECLYILTISEGYTVRARGSKDNRLKLYQYQQERDCWVEVENAGGMVPPMSEWLGPDSKIDCFEARMIPSCLGDGTVAYKDIPDGPMTEEEEYGYYLGRMAQGRIFLNDSD